MFFCPHCNLPGISTWNKVLAGPAVPAICRECKKPSSIGGTFLGIIGGILHPVLLAGTAGSFYLRSWWPLILCVLGSVVLEILVVKYAPLKPLNEKQIKKKRLSFAIFATVFVLLVLVAGIFL